jgi:hypothetical protein
MTKKPKLTIDYGTIHLPISATCSTCGEEMPEPGPHIASASEILKWFEAQFAYHLNLKHADENRRLASG